MSQRTAVIIGAGPAGLTAAHEMLTRTDIKPIVLEMSSEIGGISRTVRYNGNRIDIGGHRFFSKSERVMNWWLDRLPLEKSADNELSLKYQGRERTLSTGEAGVDPDETDAVMLIRSRKSRIYWRRELFDYPLKLSPAMVKKMGLWSMGRAGLSYMRSAALPVKPEKTLEDFLINRFGRELYLTFFKSYTEKVWGVPCEEIPADWGAQRIKGLSIRKAIAHALRRKKPNGDVSQKDTETSLIERFLYPKFGPGQLWEIVADEVREMGGDVIHHQRATKLVSENGRITEVEAVDTKTGESHRYPADYVFSSMPVNHLVAALGDQIDPVAKEIADGLKFRDFFTVGLLVNKLKLTDDDGKFPTDNWIYIQEPDVLIGRLQIFNNWSPYMVADQSKIWLGLEYFCYDTDEIWSKPDAELIELGKSELGKIGIIDPADAIDGCVIRVKKTYPAYFGTYSRMGELRDELDKFENLYCVGRNGQHKYNNQDHSMLTAMVAVDGISKNAEDKAAVWDVNVEQEYHEEKAS